MGKIIRDPKHVLLNEFPIVIGASNFYAEIYNEIINMGVHEDRIIKKIILWKNILFFEIIKALNSLWITDKLAWFRI